MRRLLLPLVVAVVGVAVVYAADASDDFAGTGALSGNWTVQRYQPEEFIDVLVGVVADDYNCAFWSGRAWASNHESRIQAVSLPGGSNYISVTVNAQQTDAAFDAYGLFTNGSGGSGAFFIQEIVDGSGTEIAHFSETISADDTIQLRRSGNNLIAYKNNIQLMCDGGPECLAGVVTDTTLTGGSAGTCIFDNAAAADNWSGADVNVSTGRRVQRRLMLTR
jgi:hypothetical protein